MARSRFLFLGLLMLSFTPAYCQEIQKPASDSSKKKEISISEVTLSAMRFPEKQKFVAQKVFGISSARMEQLNQPTTAELLMQTGQVSVQKSQMGGGSPVIRGFEANKVLIVIDGIRMNNAIYRSGHLQNVISIDNQALEKAEIIMGPASVIYGSDALGGVMSFYTKKPELAGENEKIFSKGNASVRYASAYGEMNAHADMNLGMKNFASFTSLSFSRFGNLRQGSRKYKKFPEWGNRNYYQAYLDGRDTALLNSNPDILKESSYSQFDLLQKFLFQSGKVKHQLNIQFSTTTDIPRFDRLTEKDSSGKFKSAEWYYGPQRRWLAAYTLELPSTKFYDQSRITTSYQDVLESRHNRNFGNAFLKNREENVRVLSLNGDFVKKRGKAEWYYGTEVSFNHVGSIAYAENIYTGAASALDTRYPDGGSRTMSYALYTSLLYKFNDKLILNAGGRIFGNNLKSVFEDTTFFPFPFRDISQSFHSAAGSAGLIYLPGKDWKLSGLISTGYRAPNVDDISKVFESNAGYLLIPNPNLKPERTINYELGVTKRIKGWFEAGASLWYTDYYQILTIDSTTFNGSNSIIYDGVESRVYTTVNKNRAFLWGTGLNVSAEFAKRYVFSGSIQYTMGRIRETGYNYPLDHIPPVFGRMGIIGKWNKIQSEFYMLFNGVKDSANYNLNGEDNQIYSADPVRGYTPAWSTLNLRITLNISKLISVQAGVENILDKYYRTFSSGIGAPGRNFICNLRIKW